jgi:hypothetical protein
MWRLPVDHLARAIAGDRRSISPRAYRIVLAVYYVGIIVALVLMYGINPPTAPPFIYQGF